MSLLTISSFARRTTLSLSLTLIALGLTACGPDPPIVAPEAQSVVDVDASVPAVGESEREKICNPNATCCCWRDQSGVPHCYGTCQVP